MEVTQKMFPQHIISMHCEVPWPAHSPDISACHYFLWGYLKAKVYPTRPWALDNLKTAIQKQISAMPENVARQALENLSAWLENQHIPLKTTCLLCELFLLKHNVGSLKSNEIGNTAFTEMEHAVCCFIKHV
jgi:hypothetical protein